MRVAKAVPKLLPATRDKQPLVRSASLQSLTQIGQEGTPDLAKIIAAMIAALADGEREEPVVRQSALDGLAALAGKAGAQRAEILRALAAVQQARNPRLAQSAQEILANAYKATPAELERARRPMQ